MRIPARIMIHAEISIDDNGKELKLNRWITCCTSGRNKDKTPRTISAAPLNYTGNRNREEEKKTTDR
jgi:hypothetical protein